MSEFLWQLLIIPGVREFRAQRRLNNSDSMRYESVNS